MVKKSSIAPTDYTNIMEDTRRFHKEDNAKVPGADLGNAWEPIVEQFKAFGVNAEGVPSSLLLG